MDEKIKIIKDIEKYIAFWVVTQEAITDYKDEVEEEIKQRKRVYATALYNAGYRKESDTARGLAKTIKSVVWEEFENETIRIKDLHGVIDDILRSKYGVDLGE